MQSQSRSDTYDVCVIGSGAGGGMAAHALTKAGARVALLEAGQMWDPMKDGAMLKWPYDSPRRGASTREKPFGEFDGCIGGWQIDGEPYTTAPRSKVDWWGAPLVRRRADRRRAVHDRPRFEVRLVARPHARRPDQPLGPDLAAVRALRLHPQEPRRTRRRLADHVRRREAVVRRGRQADRHLRERRGA